MRRFAALGTVVLALAALWLWLGRGARGSNEVRATVAMHEVLGGSDTAGFARATSPPAFQFPRDHGPHPRFRTEWWYFTGNLQTADARLFGYQLTFFRSALTADSSRRDSRWAAGEAYMAHFTVTDVSGRRFHAHERFSRAALDLAGARAQPFAVWLESWSARSADSVRATAASDAFPITLTAAEGDVAISLVLEQGGPPVPQGENGLSRKGAEPGNASHYYSLPRMPTRGRVRVAGTWYNVSGESWMDREWSTSALGKGRVGWDWFALQLSNGSELMYYQIRDTAGRADPFSAGTLTAAAGTTRLQQRDVFLAVTDFWTSPRGGARYPSAWRLRVPVHALDLQVEPVLPDQELNLWVRYWEGAVRVTGTAQGRPVTGRGYVELTGYTEQKAACRDVWHSPCP